MTVDAPNPAPIPAPAAPVAPPEPGAKPDEPLGEPGLAALKSEREARKASDKATADALAKLKVFEDAQKTDVELRDAELAQLRADNAALTAGKLRAEVAAEKGITGDLVDFLTASTREELEAQATKLAALVPAPEVIPDPVPNVAKYIIPDEGGVPAIGKETQVSAGMGTLRAAYAQAAEQKG